MRNDTVHDGTKSEGIIVQPIASWSGSRGPQGRPWTLDQHPEHFSLNAAEGSRRFVDGELSQLQVVTSWWRAQLRVHTDGGRVHRLRGMRRGDAGKVRQALADVRNRQALEADLRALTRWVESVVTRVDEAESQRRWIPEETVADIVASRPPGVTDADLDRYESVWHLLTQAEREAVNFADLEEDLRAWIARVNESIVANELDDRREFFNTVERSPLTEEQSRAVVCFDNRVHVIAAAGSGKTSLMVARAGYAISRGLVPPDRILLLAFNKAAASELQERIETRLRAAGIPSAGVRAETFHAFGLAVIGQATGRKPRVAPWVADGGDVAMVSRLVDELRDRSPQFRYRWDLFRLLYARVSEELDETSPDAWDPETRRTGLRTLRGEVVKSQGERLIADWLFLNGVDYRYEHPYAHSTATPDRSQYRPDFYYPAVDVWHEHWGLDRDGNSPASFVGYLESMRWKQALHRQHGTALLESTWAEVVHGDGLTRLAKQLEGHGVQLDWNPDRPIPGAAPVKHEDLARLMRTFMTHVKSNSLAPADLRARAADSARSRLFLDLYWEIHTEWDARLRAEGYIDFEDMLVQAADLIAQGRYCSPYELVMVDEFQDASQARARLTRGLVAAPGRYLLAVGDDWQSINRFAGADLGVLTHFGRWFGRGPTLRLQTTFRCEQAIADTASAFVVKNPQQLRKQVNSAQTSGGDGVQVLQVRETCDVPRAIEDYLHRLQRRLDNGSLRPGPDGRLTVDILGRYNFDRQLAPSRTPAGLQVRFRTVHSAKGLEADYVVLPSMTSGTYGFPSQIADDPVLRLVMADPDPYPNAEERRLFYVALTRARRGVLLITPERLGSPFVAELLQDGHATLHTDGQPPGEPSAAVCPNCGQGFLVPRHGPYGAFLGCTAFPRCRHTTPIDS